MSVAVRRGDARETLYRAGPVLAVRERYCDAVPLRPRRRRAIAPKTKRPPGIRIRRNTRFQNRCARASKLANGRLSYSRAAGVWMNALSDLKCRAPPAPVMETMTASLR